MTYTDRKTKDIMEDFAAYVYSCGGPVNAPSPDGCADEDGYDAALATLDDIMPEWEEIGLAQLIENIMALSYDWGVSDGN